jgi:hypothetical protein
MKKVLFIAIAVMIGTSGTTLGWNVFNDGEDNYCALCHEGNVVMGAHEGVSCLSCHTAAPGDVPVTSNCADCHTAGGMVNFHNDAGITSCAMCHSELPIERRDWSEIKSLFQ